MDDDRTAGGVVGDIGGHPLALRRRPRRGHGGGVSEVAFEDREIRRFSRGRRHVEAVASRRQAGQIHDQRKVVGHEVVAEVVRVGGPVVIFAGATTGPCMALMPCKAHCCRAWCYRRVGRGGVGTIDRLYPYLILR